MADTITELLDQSHVAHAAGRAAKVRRDVLTAREFWQTAYDLRQEAHALDPEHSHHAWAAERTMTATTMDTHSALTAFYRQQLELA